MIEISKHKSAGCTLTVPTAPDLADVQHRLRTPALGTRRHVRPEALVEPEADAVQLGWIVAAGEFFHRGADLGHVFAEGLRQIALNASWVCWSIAIGGA